MNALYKNTKKNEWTEEDTSFLCESWGQQSVSRIANKLERSETAVILKARKLKLGAFLESGDYITFNQLMQVLGVNCTYKEISWIKQRRFPVHHSRVVNNSFLTVKLEEFWEWAEKNMYILDFSRIEKNILGKEPEWVAIKRKLDIRRKELVNFEPWTRSEDYMLENLLRQQRYTYYDMQIRLRRTSGAIETRCVKLNLKDRPVKAECKSWQSDEIKRLSEMILKGYGYELTALEFKVSDKCIRGLLGRLYGTENLDKAREKIKESIIEGR